jgi:hypothetical protein
MKPSMKIIAVLFIIACINALYIIACMNVICSPPQDTRASVRQHCTDSLSWHSHDLGKKRNNNNQ